MNHFSSETRTLVLSGAGVLVFVLMDVLDVEPRCIFKSVTGIPCPGCGTWRAVSSLLHADFLSALSYNPLAVLCCLYLSCLGICIIWDKFSGTNSYQRLKYFKMPVWGWVLAVIAVLVNWGWNIEKFS